MMAAKRNFTWRSRLIRWRNSGKLPYFKLSGKIYFWASDVHKFLREECKQKDFISASINS